jgi:hypothetical protein
MFTAAFGSSSPSFVGRIALGRSKVVRALRQKSPMKRQPMSASLSETKVSREIGLFESREVTAKAAKVHSVLPFRQDVVSSIAFRNGDT